MARRKTVIDSILTLMEDPAGMTNDYSGGSSGEDMDATMMIMPGDPGPEEMDMGREEEEGCGFAPEDYECARELVQKVGSIERVHELLANLENVEDTLDLEPAMDYEIDDIADQMPDEPDLPTDRHNSLGMSSLYDPGHTGHM